MVNDLTEGKPMKLIVSFSIPLLIGNIFQQFYSMVDTIIVGKFLGVQPLAAVGSTGALSSLVLWMLGGLTSGFSVIIAQRFGAGDHDGVRRSVGTSTILCIIVTVIATVLTVALTRPMLELLNTPPDIIDDAADYISVIFAGTAAVVFYNMLSGILRALGDSRTPLYFLIISSILNVILDLLFVVSFHWGVAGAAYATVISQAVSGLLCLFYMAKRFPILHLKKRDWKMDWKFTKEHLRIGCPMGIMSSVTAIGIMLLQSALNQFGSTTVAAYTAASKVEQLVVQPAMTFGTTMATYCGQNLGAGRIDRIREGVNQCTLLSLIVSVIAGAIVVLFGKQLTLLFISGDKTDEVINLSRQYLNTIAAFLPVLGMLFIYRNSMQGMGETIFPMLGGVMELAARTVAVYTLPFSLGFGYAGLCFASPLAWIAATVLLFLSYRVKLRKKLAEYSSYCDSSSQAQAMQ